MLKVGTRWTDAEDDKLRDYAKAGQLKTVADLGVIAKAMGRSLNAIEKRAQRIGVRGAPLVKCRKKPPRTPEEQAAAVERRRALRKAREERVRTEGKHNPWPTVETKEPKALNGRQYEDEAQEVRRARGDGRAVMIPRRLPYSHQGSVYGCAAAMCAE